MNESSVTSGGGGALSIIRLKNIGFINKLVFPKESFSSYVFIPLQTQDFRGN